MSVTDIITCPALLEEADHITTPVVFVAPDLLAEADRILEGVAA